MKMKLFAALMCLFVLVCAASVFADPDDDLGGDVSNIIDPIETQPEPIVTEPPVTEPPVTEPPQTVPPQTEPATTTTAEPEPEPEPEPDPYVDPDPYVEPEPVVTAAPQTEKESETTKKPKETKKRDTTEKETETEKAPETKIIHVTEEVTGDVADFGGSNFSSATHVAAYVLGIPLIVSFFGLILVIIRRLIYRNK